MGAVCVKSLGHWVNGSLRDYGGENTQYSMLNTQCSSKESGDNIHKTGYWVNRALRDYGGDKQPIVDGQHSMLQ
jgi:hypothetical protein